MIRVHSLKKVDVKFDTYLIPSRVCEKCKQNGQNKIERFKINFV